MIQKLHHQPCDGMLDFRQYSRTIFDLNVWRPATKYDLYKVWPNMLATSTSYLLGKKSWEKRTSILALTGVIFVQEIYADDLDSLCEKLTIGPVINAKIWKIKCRFWTLL